MKDETLYDEGYRDGARGAPGANANLIAAAPDLLEVAYACAAYFSDTDAPLGKVARAALAKATLGLDKPLTVADSELVNAVCDLEPHEQKLRDLYPLPPGWPS